MRLVKYKDIDSVKWNTCVSKLPQAYFYGLFEYLSAICQWQAIIEENEEGYLFVIPLPFKSKLFLKYIYQPFFCQQLGVFGVSCLSVDQELEVFKLIKNNFVFGSINWSFKPKVSDFIDFKEQPNFVLNLDRPFDQIEKGFKTNRKRILKKCNNIETTIKVSDGVESIIKAVDAFGEGLGDRFVEIKPNHYEALKKGLISVKEYANVQVFQLLLDKEIIAAVLIVEFNNRLIYMLGYIDEKHKKSGVNSLLFTEIMKRNVLLNKVLDFEGGKNGGIAQFYSSFGARPIDYYRIVFRTKMNEILKIVR